MSRPPQAPNGCTAGTAPRRATGSRDGTNPAPTPVRLGSLLLDGPFLLAPMAGYTDSAFRLVCREMGAALVFTELVSADGLHFGGRKTREILDADPRERPLGAQVFGIDEDRLAGAAREIEAAGRFDLIDLNMGCPVRKIVRKGAGAALIRDPARVERCVARVAQAVGLPVTVKLRTEWTTGDNAGIEAALAAERGGASAVAVHARAWCRRHRGEADLDALARLRDRLSIPVIGNGGIRAAPDAPDMMRRTGVEAVMIARGALGYPWIFRETSALARGGSAARPCLEEWRAVILRHYDLTVETFATRSRRDPEFAATVHFRKHAIAYLRRLPGYASFASRVPRLTDRASARSEIELQIERVAAALHAGAPCECARP